MACLPPLRRPTPALAGILTAMDAETTGTPDTTASLDSHCDQLIAWDHEHIWHPFTPMTSWFDKKDPLIITHGQDEFLFDIQGRRYIDGVSSLWCNIHGHRVPQLDAALARQIAQIAHTTLLGACNVPSIELAKLLADIAPPGLKKVFYSDNGSTAVEVALKMAWQFWRNIGRPEKCRFLALSAAYHGDTLGAVSVGGIEAFHDAYRGLCFDVMRANCPQIAAFSSANVSINKNVPFDSISFEDKYISQMVAENAASLAAIIVEPVIQGAGGMRMQPRGTLTRLRQLCNQHNILLICDEVMTGFGRTGAMFACNHENISPDLLCLSKGLTGGYMPLGATLTTQPVFDAFCGDPNAGKTFFHGHTFTGHPLACAVAIASIELMLASQLCARSMEMSGWLESGLAPLQHHPHVADIRITGAVAAVEIVQSRTPRIAYPWQRRVGGEICRRLRPHGVLLRPLGDVIVIMPPLTTRHENVATITRSLCEVLGA